MVYVHFVGVDDLGDFFQGWTFCLDVEEDDKEEFQEDPHLFRQVSQSSGMRNGRFGARTAYIVYNFHVGFKYLKPSGLTY